MKYNIQCEHCGQFCKPHDSGTYYGSCIDMEPPDESFFCKKCVDKELETPERVIVGCWWLKPNYVRIAKSILRHRNWLTKTRVQCNIPV